MSCREKSNLFSVLEFNVGGIDYVPPTLCPRSAYTPANAAAYGKATGTIGLNEIRGARLVRHSAENFSVLEMG